MREMKPGSRRTGLRDARRGEYAEYMRSGRWFRRRATWVGEHAERGGDKPRCVGCDEAWTLSGDMHHCDYDRLGEESYEDLWPMCRACHTELHTILDGQKFNTSVSYRQRNGEALNALRAARAAPMSALEQLQILRKFM